MHITISKSLLGLQQSSAVKKPSAGAGDMSLIPESGRSPGEGNGNPLQYAAWEIPWAIQSTVLQRVRHDSATKQQQQNPSLYFREYMH